MRKALILVDQIAAQRAAGRPQREAVIKATVPAALAFRPLALFSGVDPIPWTVTGLGLSSRTSSSFRRRSGRGSPAPNAGDRSGEATGRAIGTWAGVGALASAVGPMPGGGLVETVGWRSIFLLNLPVGAAAAWLAWRYVPESRDRRANPGLDLFGALLVTAALALLTGKRRAQIVGERDDALHRNATRIGHHCTKTAGEMSMAGDAAERTRRTLRSIQGTSGEKANVKEELRLKGRAAISDLLDYLEMLRDNLEQAKEHYVKIDEGYTPDGSYKVRFGFVNNFETADLTARYTLQLEDMAIVCTWEGLRIRVKQPTILKAEDLPTFTDRVEQALIYFFGRRVEWIG